MKFVAALLLSGLASAQEHQHAVMPPVPLQPLAQQVRQVEEALNYLGQPLAAADGTLGT